MGKSINKETFGKSEKPLFKNDGMQEYCRYEAVSKGTQLFALGIGYGRKRMPIT